MRPAPNSRPPHHRRCRDCARGCTTAPLRLASCAPRPTPSSRHAFMIAGSKSQHFDRELSVPAPTSNPTTTTPILPQLCQSTGCSSYPSPASPHSGARREHRGGRLSLHGGGGVGAHGTEAPRRAGRHGDAGGRRQRRLTRRVRNHPAMIDRRPVLSLPGHAGASSCADAVLADGFRAQSELLRRTDSSGAPRTVGASDESNSFQLQHSRRAG